MQSAYLMAGVLAVVTGIVHSLLGERLIFRHLRKDSVVPALAAPPLRERHIRILWATWHLASVFGWAFAVILLRMAFAPVESSQFIAGVIVAAHLGAAILVFFATKGRHPGWLALLAVAVLTWVANVS